MDASPPLMPPQAPDPVADPAAVGSVARPLVDSFGRRVTYLRLSVTDRCDLRCGYCMAEDMVFLPKRDLLTLEELDRVAAAFIARGVTRIRITGGEPLHRRGILTLFQALGARLRPKTERGVGGGAGAGDGAPGLEDLTLTTNATRLTDFAAPLAAAGVRRVNVSLDTLDRERFRALTRGGDLSRVLAGIAAAQEAGLAVKINTVALKDPSGGPGTEDEADRLLSWCGERGFDLTFIETMPLGHVTDDRADQYLPLERLRARLARHWTLTESAYRTGGPARYWDCAQTGTRVGFITPLSHNFCEGCNRVRLTCTGTLFLCLGQEDSLDLRAVLRDTPGADSDPAVQAAALDAALDRAMIQKPKGHDFAIDRPGAAPALPRHMSTTGG